MKKVFTIFAAFVMLTFLLPVVNARAEEANPNTINDVDTSSLTLEYIEDSFWEVLVVHEKTRTEEDRYSHWLIAGINERNVIHIYGDEPYVSYSIGGIELEKVNYDRLIKKFQRIIDLYNYTHPLELIMVEEKLNERYAQVTVKSTNLEYIENPVCHIGDMAKVRTENLTYWESAQYWGSGSSGVINKVITPTVKVDGVAYLSDDGEVTEIDFNIENNIKIWKRRMLHISIDEEVLGWVYSTDLVG